MQTRVLPEEERRERGGGALTVHAVAGWEGALHNLQERDETGCSFGSRVRRQGRLSMFPS